MPCTDRATPRGDSGYFLERAAERRLRVVAHLESHGGDLRPSIRQEARGDLEPPAGEILHRRMPDEMGESRRQRRARQPRAAGEHRERPRIRWARVQERQRATDVPVTQAREPTLLRGGKSGEVTPHHFDEHQLAQAEADAFAARSRIGRLGHREVDELLQGIARRGRRAAHVKQPRQGDQQWVERTHVTAEKAADEVQPIRAAASLADRERELAGRHLAHERQHLGQVRAEAHAGSDRHDIGITVREHEDIAGLKLHSPFPDQPAPAGACRHHVVRDDVLGAGQDSSRPQSVDSAGEAGR